MRKILRYGPDGPVAFDVDAADPGDAPLSDGRGGFSMLPVAGGTGATGVTGPTGPTGPAGPTGPTGAAGGVVSGMFTQAMGTGTPVGVSAALFTHAVVGALTSHQLVMCPTGDPPLTDGNLVIGLGWGRVSAPGIVTYLAVEGQNSTAVIEWVYRLIPRTF